MEMKVDKKFEQGNLREGHVPARVEISYLSSPSITVIL